MRSIPQRENARQVADLEQRAGHTSPSGSGGLGGSQKGDLRACSALDEGNFQFPCKVVDRRTTFLLQLESTRGDGIKALRAILKSLLRRHAFRCVDLREVRGRS
jgi:hypothetical protein